MPSLRQTCSIGVPVLACLSAKAPDQNQSPNPLLHRRVSENGVIPAAWLDVRRAYIDRFKELTHSTCNEFWTVVTPNELWNTPNREQVNQHVDKVVTAQLPANF